MNIYEPQQFLSFQEVIPPHTSDEVNPNQVPKVYLKSANSVLVKANESLARLNSVKDPFTIEYQVVKNEKYSQKHIEDDVVFINQPPEGPKSKYDVKVIVYKMDGTEGGQITSTISGDADIQRRDTN